MSIEQLEEQVLHLPRDARRSFARWFYEHENQIVEPREDDEVSMATQAEILRRSAELDANPGLAVPVIDEWFEQLKRRLNEAPSQAPRLLTATSRRRRSGIICATPPSRSG